MKHLPQLARKVAGLFFGVTLLIFVLPPRALAQDNTAAAQCIGRGLTEYMNAVIAGAGSLAHVKLLSPALNLTSQYVPAIFDEMEKDQANFAGLTGFAGNTYRIEDATDPQHRSPYDWYVQMGWKDKFAKYGKGVYITETGNFNGPDVPVMQRDFSQMDSAGEIRSINYFNALGLNSDPRFQYAYLQATQYNDIVKGSGKAGANSAVPISGTTFVDAIRRPPAYNAKWAVEILLSKDDLESATQAIKGSGNITHILRLCIGDSCGFSDPQVLISFLNDLEQNIKDTGKTVYVIAGPNEPDAEYWATPNCPRINPTAPAPGQTPIISGKPIPTPYVSCNEVRSQEFHSLRPYQASPCNQKVEQTVLFCGNDFYAKETYKLKHPDPYAADAANYPAPGGGTMHCTGWSGDTSTCTYDKIKSAIPLDIRLDPADLPILGNTQLVPNSINPVNALDNATRVNEYVSWYLNGAIYRAEESVPVLSDILKFAGPIRKLFPQALQTALRNEQKDQAGQTRHDQIVTTGPTERLSEVAKNLFNYVPFSSTEDRVGEVSVEKPFDEIEVGFPGDPFITTTNIEWNPNVVNGTKSQIDDIYFAHTEEASQLATNLQSTFASGSVDWFSGAYDDPGLIKRFHPNCDIGNYRTNPGDDLFGDYNNKDQGYFEKINGNISYTTEKFTCPFTRTCRETTDVNGNVTTTCESDTCERYAYTYLKVFTKSPKINEIYERLVKGKASVVGRIFPQELIAKIKDVPASVKAIYDTFLSPLGNGTEAIAGNVNEPTFGDNARLFIPHLGSVYDYFLEGVQCALRPKGMCGNPAYQAPATSAPVSIGACSAGTPNSVPTSVTDLISGSNLKPLEAGFLDASNKFKVPVCVLKAVAGIETGFDTINWREIMAQDPSVQERYLWEGNTELMCDQTYGEEKGHNQCSARGPFQILTGVEGVYCRDVAPKCPYNNPRNCLYSCPAYCNASGVSPTIVVNGQSVPLAGEISTWQGVSNSSARSNPSPANFYDEVMAAANVLNYKTSPNNPALRPKTTSWTEAQEYTAGKNYFGSDEAFPVLGGRTYGGALVDYCNGEFPELFPQ